MERPACLSVQRSRKSVAKIMLPPSNDAIRPYMSFVLIDTLVIRIIKW